MNLYPSSQDLQRDLQDPEYLKFYGSAEAKAEFAVTLGEARHNSGLTQRELADRLGLTQPYIAKLEGGDANPTLGTVGSLLARIGLRLRMRSEPLVPLRRIPVHCGINRPKRPEKEKEMSLTGIQWEAAGNVLVETVDNLELTPEEAIAILEAEVARRDREEAE